MCRCTGLGRYGDPLDPDGDLAAMKEAYIKLKEGGSMLVAVPAGPSDEMIWYSSRIYGPLRLPLLCEGWEYHGLVDRTRVYGPNDLFKLEDIQGGRPSWEAQPVILLRKPIGAANLLDQHYAMYGDMANKHNPMHNTDVVNTLRCKRSYCGRASVLENKTFE